MLSSHQAGVISKVKTQPNAIEIYDYIAGPVDIETGELNIYNSLPIWGGGLAAAGIGKGEVGAADGIIECCLIASNIFRPGKRQKQNILNYLISFIGRQMIILESFYICWIKIGRFFW